MVIEESRKFYFAIETEEELEEWLTFLEFAKSYVGYNRFY